MIAILALVLLLVLFGAGGFALHILWYVLIAAIVLWLLGFLFTAAGPDGTRRRWYRW